jgi:hypothetical protein
VTGISGMAGPLVAGAATLIQQYVVQERQSPQERRAA